MILDDPTRPDALKVLRDLLALLSHPSAARELIDEMEQATSKHNEAAAVAEKARDELRAAEETSRAAMERELAEHRRTMTDDRLALGQEINQRRQEVSRDEQAAKAAREAAENDAAQAAELRARWQRKIDQISAAA
jgi:hypothetical protein